MIQSLQEVCRLNNSQLQVHRESDVIRGVKILGLESRNGRSYRPATLAKAVTLYEGAKVNVNHPKTGAQTPRDYQDRIGVVRNVAFRDGGLFADLQYNPKHQLAEQLAWDAEHAPENVGLSHNVEARVARHNSGLVVDEILKVRSIDLVADPATTRSLFEGSPDAAEGKPDAGDRAGGESSYLALQESNPDVVQAVMESLTIEALRNNRPDLVDSLAEEQHAELSLLREAVESYRTLDERKSRVRAVLREYALPDPDLQREQATAVLGEEFMERLLNIPDETAMRQVVRERAQLISQVRGWAEDEPAWSARPVSRDQQRPRNDWAAGESTERFVRAITG